MSIDVLVASLMKVLLSHEIPFYELMSAYNIQVSIANMNVEVYGFTYVSRSGNYHLILNGNISYEVQCKVFVHELKHILEDCPNKSYYIGMDMQYEYIEFKADMVAEEAVKYCR